MDHKYDWIGFYEKFADALLSYKNDRKLLIERIQQAYNQAQLTMPKLDSTAIPEDIDPYTVFGLFNKGISDDNRRRIIAALAENSMFRKSSRQNLMAFQYSTISMQLSTLSAGISAGRTEISTVFGICLKNRLSSR